MTDVPYFSTANPQAPTVVASSTRTRAHGVTMVSSVEKTNKYLDELKATAKKIAGRGRGILAR